MVPMLIVMSGALAFSAFSGNISNNVTASAGTLSYNENVTVVNYYSGNTMLGVGNYYNGQGSFATQLGPNDGNPIANPVELGWAGVSNSGMATLNFNVSNMAPGNWVEFQVYDVNNGTVGAIFGAFGNPDNMSTAVQMDAGLGVYFPTSTSAFLSDVGNANDQGWVTYITFSSGNSGSLDSGQGFSWDVYLGLAQGSGNSYQMGGPYSLFGWTLTAGVTSDA